MPPTVSKSVIDSVFLLHTHSTDAVTPKSLLNSPLLGHKRGERDSLALVRERQRQTVREAWGTPVSLCPLGGTDGLI